MPNMLGIDAVKALRARLIKTPIIMVTTEAERSQIVLAIQAGATNYLAKPFSKESFQEKVLKVLPELADYAQNIVPLTEDNPAGRTRELKGTRIENGKLVGEFGEV